MKKRYLFFICLSSLLGYFVLRSPNHLKDLNFIHKAILENHPGVYNTQDPDFNKHLQKAYFQAKNDLIRANGDIEKKRVLSIFSKSFNDVHLSINWSNSLKKKQTRVVKNFNLSYLSHEIIWVTVPTFDFLPGKEVDKSFNQLARTLFKVKQPKHIIFDIRGNCGGNSAYGNKIVDSFFGKAYADQQRYLYEKNVSVDWKASQGNVNHLALLVSRYPQYPSFKIIQAGLQKSLDQKKPYYREDPEGLKTSEKNLVSQVPNTKVIVLIDSLNVSAALDFIDDLKSMTKNITLVGQTTKADRLYMEIRSLPLPSGQGVFNFPIKVYRNRPRLDNQPYKPSIQYDDINNTSAIQESLIKKIKQRQI